MASESSLWVVRNTSDYLDLYDTYGWDNKNYFTMMLHHGGNFEYYPNRDYDGGKIDYIDFIEVETFSPKVFQSILTSFGYDVETTYAYSLVSFAPLDVGLNKLAYWNDFINFVKNYLCTKLYSSVASNPKITVWEARIMLFDKFNFWINVDKLIEALDYTKYQVNLLGK
ncbi:unnamed protein product [Lactuca saligna]|uniref:PB1-like domain-containing protein n=1 Tax=Lactuca saligna TaxID=75948 RepID=A0AA35YC11_LACSI|nr:unnamed protein product [Lactuca saligna]